MTITAPAPAVTTPRVRTALVGGRYAAATVAQAPQTLAHEAPARQETLDASVLLRWGFAVDKDGIGAHEDSAEAVVDAATRRGLRPILIEILANKREPSVARQRAFGRLALALAR